jgi:hypothetical protein
MPRSSHVNFRISGLHNPFYSYSNPTNSSSCCFRAKNLTPTETESLAYNYLFQPHPNHARMSSPENMSSEVNF